MNEQAIDDLRNLEDCLRNERERRVKAEDAVAVARAQLGQAEEQIQNIERTLGARIVDLLNEINREQNNVKCEKAVAAALRLLLLDVYEARQ